MNKLLCGFLLLASALAHSTLAGAASVVIGQAGAGGVSAVISPDAGEIGRPANIWMGGVLNGTLYLRNGPSTWVEYRGGPLPIALTSAALPSSLEVSIVNFDVSSVPRLDVYVGYGSTEADLSLSGHLAKVYTTVPTPTATAVGVASGSATSATIGAAGGSVSTPDGKIALTIPAGALASNTVISIQPVTNNAHGGLGAGYRLTPDGQTFAQPVVLTFSYTDQDLAGSDPEILGAAFQTAAGYWQWLGTPVIDSVARTMRVSTMHFTDIVMVRGYNLLPLSRTLNVNESLALRMVYCYPPPINPQSDDLHPLGLQCDTANSHVDAVLGFAIDEWSVNGIAGGNGTVGTVSGDGVFGTYKAPTTKPTPNVVTVSASWISPFSGRRNSALSFITILAPPTYTGTVQFTTSGPGFSVTNGIANVTWTRIEDTGDVRKYKPTGTISGDITLTGGLACNTISATSDLSTSGNNMIVYTASNSAFPKTHGFALEADLNTLLTFNCGGVSVQFPKQLYVYVGSCSGTFEPQSFTDEANLRGAYRCALTGTNATWNFTAQ